MEPVAALTGTSEQPAASTAGQDAAQPSDGLPPLADTDITALRAKLRQAGLTMTPAIFKRGTGEAKFLVQNMGIRVADWSGLKEGSKVVLPPASNPTSTKGRSNRHADRMPPSHHSGFMQHSLNPAPKLTRAVKSKSNGAGRQYTSKFRGVHQTFPTKRWEAQFRRNGKPTSLGCFDHEEEAARAYDKMVLWTELHNTSGAKGGITNYDPSEYDKDISWLQTITQDELIEALRSDGRRQAAHRMLRQKREGVPTASGRSVRARTSREGTTERDYSEDAGMGEGSADPSQNDMEGLTLPGAPPNPLAATPASITSAAQVAGLIPNAVSQLMPSLAAMASLTGMAVPPGLTDSLAGLPALPLPGVEGGDLPAAVPAPDAPMSL